MADIIPYSLNAGRVNRAPQLIPLAVFVLAAFLTTVCAFAYCEWMRGLGFVSSARKASQDYLNVFLHREAR